MKKNKMLWKLVVGQAEMKRVQGSCFYIVVEEAMASEWLGQAHTYHPPSFL